MAKAKVVNLKTGRGVSAALKPLIKKIEATGHTNIRSTRNGLQIDRLPSLLTFNPWDRDLRFSQFSEGHRLRGCCGVVELCNVWARFRAVPPGLHIDDTSVLFAAQLHALLKAERTRLAIATTIGSQKREAATLEAVGFTPVTTAINPKTRAKITLWTYHRA